MHVAPLETKLSADPPKCNLAYRTSKSVEISHLQGWNSWKFVKLVEKNVCVVIQAVTFFWDGENVTLSRVKSDLQRSGMKRARLESPGGSFFAHLAVNSGSDQRFERHGIFSHQKAIRGTLFDTQLDTAGQVGDGGKRRSGVYVYPFQERGGKWTWPPKNGGLENDFPDFNWVMLSLVSWIQGCASFRKTKRGYMEPKTLSPSCFGIHV